MDMKIPAAVAILFLAGALFFYIFAQPVQQPASNPNPQDTKEYASLAAQRKSYGIPEGVFARLPEPPQDFNAIVSLYREGVFADETFFSEKYYAQPEFYPSFLENGLTYWKNPPAGYWGAYGYGAFPIKKTIRISPGKSAKTALFVHSGYGVRTYQGIKIAAIQPESGQTQPHISLGAQEFLLAPSFPQFENGWAHAVEIEITAPKEIPRGEYVVQFYAQNPSPQMAQKWNEYAQTKGTNYFGAGTVTMDKPILELIISVE